MIFIWDWDNLLLYFYFSSSFDVNLFLISSREKQNKEYDIVVRLLMFFDCRRKPPVGRRDISGIKTAGVDRINLKLMLTCTTNSKSLTMSE